MLFPESWLRAYVNPEIDTEELSHRLTMAGLGVEDTQAVAPAFSGIGVAHIVEVEPHPNADRRRVYRDDDGSGSMLKIVCRARNAAAGLKRPLASAGGECLGGRMVG